MLSSPIDYIDGNIVLLVYKKFKCPFRRIDDYYPLRYIYMILYGGGGRV